MHVDATESSFLAVAQLLTPEFGPAGLACTLQFDYYQGGTDHSGILTVTVSQRSVSRN